MPEKFGEKVEEEKTEEKDERDFMKKHEERKRLITTPDDELIKDSHEKGHDFPEKTAHFVIGDMLERRRLDFFKEKLKNKAFFDIGCGEGGFWNALRMRSYRANYWRQEDERWENPKAADFGISHQILVDPYLEEESMDKRLKSDMKTMQIPQKNEEDIRNTIKFVKKDGLSFLLENAPESGNVMTSSINYSLIESNDYLKRIAQEIYRVTPVDGIFVSCDSDEIEEEAEKLFPYSQTFVATTKVFSKLPIHSDEELKEKYEETESKELEEALAELFPETYEEVRKWREKKKNKKQVE